MGLIQKVVILMFVSQSLFAVTGGISGGGGDVINPLKPDFQQSPNQIEHLIFSSQDLAKAFVQKKKIQMAEGTLALDEKALVEKMFSHPQLNIENVMQKVTMHVEDEEPCFTYDGLPVDGSINSEHPGTVCISSNTIAKKVNYKQVAKQTAALSLHEYAEVAGFTDDEAIELQKRALAEIP